MTPREEREQLEEQVLSPLAARSARSRGREQPEEPCPIRTAFQRDRDRIIHSKAFRRLTYKTQVFIAPEADHYRTRLTHTLEVAQIARTISRALRLNEDLTEAIALGHDLGHTPFGHAGEGALEAAYREFDSAASFHHAEQSLRVVELLEREGRGLNLTYEVRDGIRGHSKGREDLPASAGPSLATLEAGVVMYADRIAYVNHDIDDAMRAGLITAESLPSQCVAVLGSTHAQRIASMVADVVQHSEGQPAITMGARVRHATDCLKDFLFDQVYQAGSAGEVERVERVLRSLFRFYMEQPAQVPGGAEAAGHPRRLARLVCDYLAGMTDRFAAQQFLQFSLPRRWWRGG
jgi:dGTPase